MSIASEITRINNNIASAYDEAELKGATMPATENSENLATTIATISTGGGVPPTAGGMFTGATIPLTYKDNTHEYENVYNYSSAYAITISGLDGRATITGNGTNNVSVAFDVSSSTSSLKTFTITLDSEEQTLTYKGMHAHYGTTVTGILTLGYTHITKGDREGIIGIEYKFIETASTDIPLFPSATTSWNIIFSYQLLNTLLGNYSSTSIGDNFLSYCYSFNQPLTIPSGVTSIGHYLLFNGRGFNQPLDLSNVTSIGGNFLFYGSSFNQPLDLSNVTSIGIDFLNSAYAFNQPLDISNLTSIPDYFLADCRSFNQPLTIPSSVTSIGAWVLYACNSFNQPLTIPSGVTSIGDNFLYQCYSLSTIIYNASVYPTDNNSLSQTIDSKTNSSSGQGIMVYGTNRENLRTALPLRTATPFRRLYNGGA